MELKMDSFFTWDFWKVRSEHLYPSRARICVSELLTQLAYTTEQNSRGFPWVSGYEWWEGEERHCIGYPDNHSSRLTRIHCQKFNHSF